MADGSEPNRVFNNNNLLLGLVYKMNHKLVSNVVVFNGQISSKNILYLMPQPFDDN